MYSKIGEKDFPLGKRADACAEWAECEPMCPKKDTHHLTTKENA